MKHLISVTSHRLQRSHRVGMIVLEQLD